MTADIPTLSAAPTPRPSRFPYALVGCLVLAFATLATCGISGYIALHRLKKVGVELARSTARESIQRSLLSDADKAALNVEVERLCGDFEAGRIGLEELGRVLEAIAEGPAIPLGVAGHLEAMSQRSTLSSDEKAGAARAFQRFGRGLAEGHIAPAAIEQLLAPLSGQPGEESIGVSPSEHELRVLIERARTASDAARIPDAAYTIDVPTLVRKSIDEALRTR